MFNWWNSSTSDPFTNSSNQQGVLLLGDSTFGFATDNVPGPTPASGTVYEFNGTSIVEVGATDLLNSGNAGSSKGSPWTTFGVNRYNNTGYKTVFCDSHAFDSNLLWATDAVNKWLYDSTSFLKGQNYTAMKTKADGTLAALGLDRFKAIFVGLGVNDIGDNLFTATQLTSAYQSLITYLQVDFPNSPIYLVIPSNISTADSQVALQGDVRWGQINTIPPLFTDVNVCYYSQIAISLGRQTGPHWDSIMNAYEGAAIERYVRDTEIDNDVRLTTNIFPVAISAAHKAAWKTFIEASKSNESWSGLNALQVFVATDAVNEPIDLIGITQPYPTNSNYTFVANSMITFNGTANNNKNTFIIPSLHVKRGSKDDIRQAVHIAQTNTGVNQTKLIGQGVSGMYLKRAGGAWKEYIVNDGTSSVAIGGGSDFAAGTWHSLYRNDSVTKRYAIDGSQVSSDAIASVALNAGVTKIGGGDGGGNMNVGVDAYFLIQESKMHANFLSDFNTLLTALKS